MIGIAIPAHDEEELIGDCLSSLLYASADLALAGEKIAIVVVLDACSDHTKFIVQCYAEQALQVNCVIKYLEIEAHNVGIARDIGARYLLNTGARWLAFTDADTCVAPTWLSDQIALNVDVVCGPVTPDHWSQPPDVASILRGHFMHAYDDKDGHRHIHGANFGVSAEFYSVAGGFPALTCHEDVAFAKALERAGARFAWSSVPRVITSARLEGCIRGGFGDTLAGIVATGLIAEADEHASGL
ncbi:MAG: glycosyltransferase [Collimonas pratensis]|uniref:glycosyltransferase n=1 Tax=Collimonas pratensis TaxID=279113 RepID=UPI003C71404C